jgi:hypothetical protein
VVSLVRKIPLERGRAGVQGAPGGQDVMQVGHIDHGTDIEPGLARCSLVLGRLVEDLGARGNGAELRLEVPANEPPVAVPSA